MAKQTDLDRAYMECAFAMSKLSHANRKKVGAIIVSPEGGIIAEGVNGTPAGFSNECEFTEFRIDNSPHAEGKDWVQKFCTLQSDGTWLSPRNHIVREIAYTKQEVLHAETNAIAKVARSTNSSKGATLYCTLTPCFHCAKLIIQAGIKRVVYSELYPIDNYSGQHSGLDLLAEAKIQVDRLELHSDHKDDLDHQDEGRGYDPDENFR
jgi:dCMP deaminase